MKFLSFSLFFYSNLYQLCVLQLHMQTPGGGVKHWHGQLKEMPTEKNIFTFALLNNDSY